MILLTLFVLITSMFMKILINAQAMMVEILCIQLIMVIHRETDHSGFTLVIMHQQHLHGISELHISVQIMFQVILTKMVFKNSNVQDIRKRSTVTKTIVTFGFTNITSFLLTLANGISKLIILMMSARITNSKETINSNVSATLTKATDINQLIMEILVEIGNSLYIPQHNLQ